MLHEFLKAQKKTIFSLTEKNILNHKGVSANNEQLHTGLNFFFQEIVDALLYESPALDEEVRIKEAAAALGQEMLRIGFTISNVVNFYGSICQAITELATDQNFDISSNEFHTLNRCLDVGIAGAVTAFQDLHISQLKMDEVKRCGFCAHELRNALGTVVMTYDIIKTERVGLSGSLGRVMENSLKRMDALIGRSLVEVKLGTQSPTLNLQKIHIRMLIDQMLLTAQTEARKRRQIIKVQVSPDLIVLADLQFLFSAISNLIQNALKFTHDGGRIQIRAHTEGPSMIFEVEDECGGIKADTIEDLFKPFQQHNENRKGLGLGLTLARKAIELHQGTLEAQNLPHRGCIFKITLPVLTRSEAEC